MEKYNSCQGQQSPEEKWTFPHWIFVLVENRTQSASQQLFPVFHLKTLVKSQQTHALSTMLGHRLAPAPSSHHQWDTWLQFSSPPSPAPPAMDRMPSFSSVSLDLSSPPPSKVPFDFSPPLIAMLVIVAMVFVIITFSSLLSRQLKQIYCRYRRRRRRYGTSSSPGDIVSPPYSFDLSIDGNFHILSPNGLDESVIKTIPLSVHARKSGFHDCAVCLLQFEENDCVRTLPICSHAFHVDCIDTWLRSHPNCPLCRSGIFRQGSPFRPMMAARIRPNLDDMIVDSIILQPQPEISVDSDATTVGEITQEPSPRQSINQPEERLNGRDFLLKRSYSFGFERNLGSERLVIGPSTASPWGYRRGGVGNFWSKRRSPFSSFTKPRLFSFNYYRGMKSPFFRRRNLGGFFPLSESSARHGFPSGGGSSRQSKSFASPIFIRPSVTPTSTPTAGFFSSSRLRSGDPEALLSPERYNREVD